MAHTQNSSNSTTTRRSLRLLTAERKSTATTASETNIDDEEEPQPTARQAKFKALEAISISNNKRRIEPESEANDGEQDESEKQDLEEHPTNSNNRKRTHSKQTSSSSSHSVRHVSNTVRRRKRSKKSATRSEKSSPKTVKRQRQLSSDEEDNRSLSNSKSKRNSAPVLPDRTRSKSNLRKRSNSNSDLEQQSEGPDTGNLCVRRGQGERELNTVVSDPATTHSRRSRASAHHRRYSNKTPIDYLTTGQSSSSRSSVPVTNTGGIDGRPCDSHSSLPSSTHPLHLFNSPAYYQQTASPPPSSSAQSFSGVVPTASYSTPFLASAAAASSHRNTKSTLAMSTESDTDPENNVGHTSESPRDVLSDPAFARAASAAAAAAAAGGGGSTSAALFHTLSGRVQHLMSRVGGSSSLNAINGRLQQYIQGIQSPDPDVRLTTLNELCSLLVMSNEETLPGFQFRVLYPPLRDCLADENEANAEIALTACRALTYLMEALPRSAGQIVEATPIFLSKLRSITSIDIAEQVLTALEMISKRNGKQILIADGIGACLEYIEFFSITSQNKSLAIVANCCIHILSRNDFNHIRGHLENLSNRLRSDDKKTVEHVCSIFSRLVENFHRDSSILREIASTQVLKTMQTMLVVQPSLLNSVTFVSIIHMLYIFSAYCPILAVTLLKMNIAEIIMCLLTGSNEGKSSTKSIPITYKSAALSTNETIPMNVSSIQPVNSIELIPRTPQELYEIVSLIGEMMPRLPTDEPLFQVDQLFRRSALTHRAYDASSHGYVLWHWQDDQGQLRPYSLQDSRTIEHAWQQHEEEVQLMISARHYLIDLQQLQQINEETNQARFIKRIVAPETTDSTPESIDESTNTNNRQLTAATTTANSSVDARTEMMKDNMELYSSFIQSLFTVLYEVYNSSAGPAVKHRCLQAVLRMIYYSPSDLLEIILKQQSISSHIASMLASSDYKIVASALQMAEILMKKLPQIFSIYFYREGVVHQIEILIGFGVTSSVSSASNASLARHNHTSGSRSQLDLAHLNDNSSLSQVESIDEQLRKANPRRCYTTTETHATTRIETRSQRGRLPKTSARSMFEEFSSRPIANRTAGASFSTGTLDINFGRGRPTRGHVASPAALFRPTSSFDPSTYYPRPPMYVPSPYAYASSVPAAATLINPIAAATAPPQRPSQMILSSQEKAKLKEWIQNQAKHFRSTYFSNNSSTSNTALQIINRLAAAVDILHIGKDQQENAKALRDIANIIAKGDVSPFEMVHTGLITKLFQYLTDDITIPNDRPERLKQFLNIFMNIPLENEQDNETTLKQYIVELHHSQINQGKTHHHRNEHNILSHLINKLHGCINQLEQFPIRINDIAGRPAHSSALRLITTHQLKCNLVRYSQCKTLKQWNSGPVKIDPLALVSAIEKYLLLRGIAHSTIDDPSNALDDDESEVSNESDADDVINVLTRSSTMRLEFLINDHIIPHNMTIYQAVRLYSVPTQRTADNESETDTDESIFSSSSIWTRVHTINYRQATNSSSTVAAVNAAIGAASTTTTTTTTTSSSNRMRRSVNAQQNPSKKTIKTFKRSSTISNIDDLWLNGQCKESKSFLISTLDESLSSILTINDLSLNAIFLLRILHGLNLYWYDLYIQTNAMFNHQSSTLTLISKSEFLSAKLTSKVNRQLQDPVVIMMGQIPSWITEMGYSCSFLFPFETRQMLFYPCAFDRERAMQRLLDSSDMLTQQHNNDQTDRQSIIPRIERKKVQLSRANILPEMEKILDNWNSKHFLEVQYEDEVGFGLGPTLEAYSLISKELQKNGLELWRTDRIFDSTKDASSLSEYVDSRYGLYPAPIGRNTKANAVTKIRQKFKFIGKFMGKALMDSRMIDMPFSVVFYKWILGQEETLNLEDLIHVDANLYEQFKKLQTIVNIRNRLMIQCYASNQQILNKSNNKKNCKSKDDSQTEILANVNLVDENDERLLLDGCKISDLSLVFTLPGHPNIELRKGGKDCLVTIENLDQYINLVAYWTLVEGVRRQFESFRDGFNSIFPIQHLKCFYPDELHQVFCGSGSTELWDLKVLVESTRCDHGYNLNSRAVKWLFEIMINFEIDEQRAFLQFVTGSPRLPVGGFRMLHPPLTIVRKTAENSSDNSNPDSFLPSVMTCVNYLKLPDYTSQEIMKAKLTTAIRDGQYAFLLS
ncbi:unnamed protein product [Rotaria socialis]|uniref:E3 ubiquitin-protein ligase n=1 Tax=Rotaria socialis TaxID=392032 RepID=A0A820TUV3_9BILA|nr:unnamed protein product [Rotaria socialis]CAF4476936.1 unnamed protein product [Rotaria socialis]